MSINGAMHFAWSMAGAICRGLSVVFLWFGERLLVAAKFCAKQMRRW
jgi:hypothetical protein